MIADSDNHNLLDTSPPTWAEAWQLWTVIIPRRSITGRLVFGKSGGATLGAVGFIRSSSSMRMVAMNDQRLIGRTKIAKGALLFFSEKTGVHSCTVRDLTNRGAGIRAQNLKIVPVNFALSFDNFRAVHMCRLI